tara:strand:- start:1337 stop:1567 length:231 start_codon:yes stop_codon:yes gene_type:complete
MDKSEKTQTNSEKMIAISILEKLEKAIKEYDKGDWCPPNECPDEDGEGTFEEDHRVLHAENCYNMIVDIINELKKR